MQPATELNQAAPEFHALTAAGIRELGNYRGRWLALMYCPRGSCADRPECLEGLHVQARAIGALGGQLLMLHPALAAEDKVTDTILSERDLRSVNVGTVLDPKFLERYQVSPEDGLGHGVTGVFLIDPQGKMRAAARYTACAPVVAHEIAALMRTAIERFGRSGKETPASPAVERAAADSSHGCVEWFQYR